MDNEAKMVTGHLIRDVRAVRARTLAFPGGGGYADFAPETRPAHPRPAPSAPPRRAHQVPAHFPARKANNAHTCYWPNTAGVALPANAQHTRRTKASAHGVGGGLAGGRWVYVADKAKFHQPITPAHGTCRAGWFQSRYISGNGTAGNNTNATVGAARPIAGAR